MKGPLYTLAGWLAERGVQDTAARLLAGAALALLLAGVAIVANLVAKRILLSAIGRFVRRSRTHWDDILLERKVFTRLSHLVPALIIYFAAPLFPALRGALQRLSMAYMIFTGLFAFYGLADAAGDIYHTFDMARQRPIKGYLQIAKLITTILVAVLTLAMVMERSPWLLLSGLGAMTAVLILVFRDTILGLVASIQLSQNDMVRIGDWIEMPKYGADGTVIDVSLPTVKVRNWDQTITTIPSYSMISDSFKNWRGMSESGGRRIKRALYIDMTTIRFLDDGLRERLGEIELIREHLRERQAEIDSWNRERGIDPSSPVNGRSMTNIGIFRAYVVAYLRQHPKIHQDMTFLIRHLQPAEKGLPIEIYVFSNDQEWAHYEDIQADIFDHLLAMVPQFDLRVFQQPSSHDLQAAARGLRADTR